MKKFSILVLVMSVLFSCNNSSDKSGKNADNDVNTSQTIYYGGDIITMDGDKPVYTEAVVSDNDIIVFVGSQNEAFKKYGNARKHDLEGRTMFPAFIDPHSHFMSAIRMVSQVNVAAPPVGTATDIPSIMQLLADHKKDNNMNDDEWLVGWGYDQDLIKEKRHITKTDIDQYFPNNKVLIVHVSMHGAILNSKALEWAGIDKNTKTPAGGIIARMPDSNEPAGLLMEMAYIPVFAKMPQPSDEEMLALMKPAQMMYASNGYAQAVEGFSHVSDMDLLKEAAAANKIFLDIISLPGFTEMDKWLNNPDYPFGVYNNHLKFGGGKFTLDGSPQGKTAFMSYPYLTGGPNGEDNWYGSTAIPREELA